MQKIISVVLVITKIFRIVVYFSIALLIGCLLFVPGLASSLGAAGAAVFIIYVLAVLVIIPITYLQEYLLKRRWPEEFRRARGE